MVVGAVGGEVAVNCGETGCERSCGCGWRSGIWRCSEGVGDVPLDLDGEDGGELGAAAKVLAGAGAGAGIEGASTPGRRDPDSG